MQHRKMPSILRQEDTKLSTTEGYGFHELRWSLEKDIDRSVKFASTESTYRWVIFNVTRADAHIVLCSRAKSTLRSKYKSDVAIARKERTDCGN